MAARRKTHAELAAVLGISPSTTQRRLSGAAPFSTHELDTLAEWLQVPVSRLTTKTRNSYAP